MKYPKIKTLFKRDPATNYKTLIEGAFSSPEFEYLQHCTWRLTEKVHGQNIRVMWDGSEISFGGRGSKADKLYKPLLVRLQYLFSKELMIDVFGEYSDGGIKWILYGEGYGARIQKGGENYNPDGVDFVMFDINWGGIWLHYIDVIRIAADLCIDVVPVIDIAPISTMIKAAKNGFKSNWGDFEAEGIVARPLRQLMNFQGQRVITKLKCKDFEPT